MRSLPTVALTASVGALGLAMAPPAAAASPDDAVAYLAAQIVAGGDRLTVEVGGQSFDDLGLTIDAVLAMTAQGSGGDVSRAATDYVVAHAEAYSGGDGEVYSAPTAKLLTFATARGLDPHDVDGVDLVTQLQSLEQDNGQFADRSEWGDYSNTLGQSFGIIGLKRAGTNPSTASVDFLLTQQCDDGGFSLDLTNGCVSDPDATSLAVQALDVVGGHGNAVQAAAAYLEGRQETSGGVGGGTSTEAANANSTGLAAIAFRLAGREGPRAEALTYLDSLTLDCDTPDLAGAIAYTMSDVEAARAEGRSASPDATTTRATAQAALGRTSESYASVTSQGQSAATPTVDCGEATPGEEPTPGEEETPGEEPTPGTRPEIPAVVQTDGLSSGVPGWQLALGMAGIASGLTLAARRRGAPRQ